jgi:hypothetical protein
MDRSLLKPVENIVRLQHFLNGSSAPVRRREGPFTGLGCALLAFAVLFGGAGIAKADRVVLLPPYGDDDQERLDDIEEVLAAAILAAGHTALTERGAVPEGEEPPSSANEMRAIAEMQNAQYLVVARVSVMHDSYRVAFRVGYAPAGRVEELEVLVYNANEAERLREVMTALLRPEGVGEDAARLTEDPNAPTQNGNAEEEARRRAEEEARRREEEERARREFEEREAARLAAEQAEEDREWDEREQYGVEKQWMVSGGFDFRPIVAYDTTRAGGVMWGFSVRGGRSFADVPGLEIRAALDLVLGASNGFGIAGGAAYLFSPFTDVPLHFGLSVELGLYQALSGNRVPSFMFRGAPTVAWRVTDQFYLEGALPEIQVFSAFGGVASLGVSVRAGYRF